MNNIGNRKSKRVKVCDNLISCSKVSIAIETVQQNRFMRYALTLHSTMYPRHSARDSQASYNAFTSPAGQTVFVHNTCHIACATSCSVQYRMEYMVRHYHEYDMFNDLILSPFRSCRKSEIQCETEKH